MASESRLQVVRGKIKGSGSRGMGLRCRVYGSGLQDKALQSRV